MTLKLFGGFAKGFPLQTPKTNLFRPTLTTLRRKIFDSYQSFEGLNFYDLCGGSGAVGLEALSYGADSCTLTELNSKTFGFLKKNVIEFTKKHDVKIQYQKIDGLKWLSKNLDTINQENSVLFFDPPYEKIQLYKDFFNLIESGFKGDILIESDKQKGIKPEDIPPFLEQVKTFTQGTSFITLCRHCHI
jgi:16S rRNA (guanine966-N2)-methyltransferase